MRAWTLAAMTSFAVCGLGLDGCMVVVLALRFMGVSSLGVGFCFSCRRGMYLHAERLLAKAGVARRNGEGDPHPWRGAKRNGKGGAQRRSAQENRGLSGRSLPVGVVKRGRLGKPLAPRDWGSAPER